jgi:TRAP-type C4-dicarboxylate transport system permease small subunit
MGLLVLWTWIVDGLAALGTVLIGILMLIICADVVARNLLGSSLPLVSELGALTLVMIVYLQLGTTVRHNRLARAELFLSRFSERRPRAGQVFAGIYDLAGAVMCALMAWSTLRILEKDFGSHEYIGVTGVLTFPTYPFRILIMVGIAVAAMQFLVQAVAAIYAAPKPTGDN